MSKINSNMKNRENGSSPYRTRSTRDVSEVNVPSIHAGTADEEEEKHGRSVEGRNSSRSPARRSGGYQTRSSSRESHGSKENEGSTVIMKDQPSRERSVSAGRGGRGRGRSRERFQQMQTQHAGSSVPVHLTELSGPGDVNVVANDCGIAEEVHVSAQNERVNDISVAGAVSGIIENSVRFAASPELSVDGSLAVSESSEEVTPGADSVVVPPVCASGESNGRSGSVISPVALISNETPCGMESSVFLTVDDSSDGDDFDSGSSTMSQCVDPLTLRVQSDLVGHIGLTPLPIGVNVADRDDPTSMEGDSEMELNGEALPLPQMSAGHGALQHSEATEGTLFSNTLASVGESQQGTLRPLNSGLNVSNRNVRRCTIIGWCQTN